MTARAEWEAANETLTAAYRRMIGADQNDAAVAKATYNSAVDAEADAEAHYAASDEPRSWTISEDGSDVDEVEALTAAEAIAISLAAYQARATPSARRSAYNAEPGEAVTARWYASALGENEWEMVTIVEAEPEAEPESDEG